MKQGWGLTIGYGDQCCTKKLYGMYWELESVTQASPQELLSPSVANNHSSTYIYSLHIFCPRFHHCHLSTKLSALSPTTYPASPHDVAGMGATFLFLFQRVNKVTMFS